MEMSEIGLYEQVQGGVCPTFNNIACVLVGCGPQNFGEEPRTFLENRDHLPQVGNRKCTHYRFPLPIMLFSFGEKKSSTCDFPNRAEEEAGLLEGIAFSLIDLFVSFYRVNHQRLLVGKP